MKRSLTWSIFWRDLRESPDSTDSNIPSVVLNEVNVFALLTAPLITHWSSYFISVSFVVETSHFRLKTLKSSVPLAAAFSFTTS
ncbi:hypothetical protein NP493_1225g02034 [Ridgeia piscesae]|uniref:Uncharacterized protein n=1 Tax=Ridgeia piscesae TaxID=27915 RepID=A0AAD9NIJ3_RIDPI|nr:hypothetical protein NP493_1225g02034 [Ridgeia piscesae]